jgi:hypothetical protein
MRLRPRRRNLVVWSSSGVAREKQGGPRNVRRTRARRFRRWLRTSALLMVIAVMRLARTTRSRWEPVSLVVGVVLTVIGFEVPSVAGVFLLGLLVLTVALLTGIRQQGGRGPAA